VQCSDWFKQSKIEQGYLLRQSLLKQLSYGYCGKTLSAHSCSAIGQGIGTLWNHDDTDKVDVSLTL
jgi:hypothetical protein